MILGYFNKKREAVLPEKNLLKKYLANYQVDILKIFIYKMLFLSLT
jgi:hypothetical protein